MAINWWHILLIEKIQMVLFWLYSIMCPVCSHDVPRWFPHKKGHPDKNHVTSARIEAFILICTALVQLMTPGLAFFYGGLVKDTSAAWQNWIDLLDWAGWLQVPVRHCGQFSSITGNGLNFEFLKHITRWSDFCHERGRGYVYTAPSSEQKSGDLYSLGVHKKKGGHSPGPGGVNQTLEDPQRMVGTKPR